MEDYDSCNSVTEADNNSHASKDLVFTSGVQQILLRVKEEAIDDEDR